MNSLTKNLFWLMVALPASHLLADGVVHIPEPVGGFGGQPYNPDDGITFGSSYAITPTMDGLFYDASIHEFTGQVQIITGGWVGLEAAATQYNSDALSINGGVRADYFIVQDYYEGDAKITLDGTGISFGSGTGATDTALTRFAAGTLQINGQTIITQNNLASYVTLTGTQTLTNKTIDATQLSGTVSTSRLPVETTLLGSSIELNSAETAGILPVAKGGTGATTLTGILKGNGSGAVTAVTAPAGALVGTTDTQTLSNKTFAGPVQVNGDIITSGRLSAAGGTAQGAGAVAFGGGYAMGADSFAIAQGWVDGYASFAMGFDSWAGGDYSVAMGYMAQAPGTNSVAIGYMPQAAGYHSLAMLTSLATGDFSIALGEGATAQAYSSLALGTYNVLQGSPSAWVPTDDLLIVGNGTYEARSNAFVIKKNGNTSINGSLTVSGAVSFASPPTIGANAVVTQDQLSSYQTTTGNGSGLTNLNAAALASGTIPAGVLPTTVTQLGAKVDLDNNDEVQGDLAWGRVSGKPTTVSGYGITDSIAVTRNASGRITSAIHIEPQGDIDMGQFK
jgi:hypothetical protein